VASTEAKAIETLRLAPDRASVPTDARFDEVARPGEPFDGAFRAARLAWVEGTVDHRNAAWEPPEQAARRFDAGVRAHASADALVVGTHGMVMTAWLVSIGHVAPGVAAGELWERLTFPDIVRVEFHMA